MNTKGCAGVDAGGREDMIDNWQPCPLCGCLHPGELDDTGAFTEYVCTDCNVGGPAGFNPVLASLQRRRGGGTGEACEPTADPDEVVVHTMDPDSDPLMYRVESDETGDRFLIWVEPTVKGVDWVYVGAVKAAALDETAEAICNAIVELTADPYRRHRATLWAMGVESAHPTAKATRSAEGAPVTSAINTAELAEVMCADAPTLGQWLTSET